MRRALHPSRLAISSRGSLLLVTLIAAAGTSCVEAFDGSKVEVLLGNTTHIPGDEGGGGRPPSDTHYEMWVLKDNRSFKLIDFDVVFVIDPSDRCFIEDAESIYPGLHATQVPARLEQDITAGGHTPSDEEAGDIYLAQKRVYQDFNLLTDDTNGVKSLVSHEAGLTLAGREALYDAANVPDPTDMSDTANAARLEACNTVFAAHPMMYVGNDKVFSLPLNGEYYGNTKGRDPRNAAPTGGAKFDVAQVLDDFDVMRVNWQFNDLADPRAASYGESQVGYHYLAGTPIHRTRGVVNVILQNNFFNNLRGDVSIFTDLAEDNVMF
jgi:hypothetical protein